MLESIHESRTAEDRIEIPDDLRKRIRSTIRSHRDSDILERLYVDEGLTQAEVGEVLNVDQATVSRQLRKNDIETRSEGRPPIEDDEATAVYRLVDKNGKVTYIEDGGGNPERLISEHQLVALQDFSASEVFGAGNDVHHLMGAPHAVDLCPNLIVLDSREHIRRHAEGTATVDDPETVLQHIFGEFEPFEDDGE